MDSRRPHLPLSSPRAPAPTPPVPPTPNLENFKVIQSDSNLFKVKNDPSSLVQPFQPTPAARVGRPVTAPRASRTPQLWHIFGHLSRRRPESTRQHLEHPVFSESSGPCFQSKIKIKNRKSQASESPLQPSDFSPRRQVLRRSLVTWKLVILPSADVPKTAKIINVCKGSDALTAKTGWGGWGGGWSLPHTSALALALALGSI